MIITGHGSLPASESVKCATIGPGCPLAAAPSTAYARDWHGGGNHWGGGHWGGHHHGGAGIGLGLLGGALAGAAIASAANPYYYPYSYSYAYPSYGYNPYGSYYPY